MASQGVFRGAGELDTPAALSGLEVPQSRLVSLSDEGVSQTEHPALKVHVLPLQAQELALSHTGVNGQHVEGFEPIARIAGRFEESFCLLPVQGSYLLAFGLRWLDRLA